MGYPEPETQANESVVLLALLFAEYIVKLAAMTQAVRLFDRGLWRSQANGQTLGGLACLEICLSVEQNIGTFITTIPTLGDPVLIVLNHTRVSFLGKYLWPDPPLPSCWKNSQHDDVPPQRLPNIPDRQFDSEYVATSEDVAFWQAVDSQIGGLSFELCARRQEPNPLSKPSSRNSSLSRSCSANRPISCWRSQSSSHRSKNRTPALQKAIFTSRPHTTLTRQLPLLPSPPHQQSPPRHIIPLPPDSSNHIP